MWTLGKLLKREIPSYDFVKSVQAQKSTNKFEAEEGFAPPTFRL